MTVVGVTKAPGICASGLHSSNSNGLGMCEGFLACSLSNLSLQQSALSECRWRRQPLDMDSNI